MQTSAPPLDPEVVRDLLVALVQVAPAMLIAVALVGRSFWTGDGRTKWYDVAIFALIVCALMVSFLGAILGALEILNPSGALYGSTIATMATMGLILILGVVDFITPEASGPVILATGFVVVGITGALLALAFSLAGMLIP